MDKLSKKVNERKNALLRSFIEQLPQRVAVIEINMRSVLESGEGVDGLSLVSDQLQKLHANSSAAGYEPVTSIVSGLQEYIVKIIKNGRLPRKETVAEMKEMIGKLQTYENQPPKKWKVQMEKSSFTVDRSRLICFYKKVPEIAEGIDNQLGYFGFPIHIIEEFSELPEFIKQRNQVVLLMDAKEIDSLSDKNTLLELRKKHPRKLNFIFLSRRDDFDTRLLAVRTGGDAFFSQPIEITRLIDKIDNLYTKINHEPYHILIVDDDLEQVSYHALILQQAGMITSVVPNPKNVFQVLVESKPELILMDMYMDGCSGIELAALIRQQEAFVGVPIVFLSEEDDLDKQLIAVSHGGDDFLTKPIKREHLISSITIRAERTRHIRFFMERDSLTGLLNHTNLVESLAKEIQRAGRIGNTLCFAMIDLDHFKTINDTYGHLTGDQVLKSLSRMLQERLRKTDIIGRYGGEEFGVILFNTDVDNAAKLLNSIRDSFGKISHRFGDKEFYVTFSCGIATYPEFRDVTAISEAADKALYEAKGRGRNRVIRAHLDRK
ncbi:MAG: diguanylate cyclase [Spirochaetia bacterium]